MVFPSFNTVPRIVHGPGSMDELADEVRRLKGSRGMVITDPGIKAAGLLEQAETTLNKAKLLYSVFNGVTPDPGLDIVALSTDTARKFDPDFIIGIGGGSSLDIAKMTSIMLTNDGPFDKYFGMEQVPNPGVPLILIPTTAGTGSEVTSICVLTNVNKSAKEGVVSRHMYARSVILDAVLTVGLPKKITAETGVDALVHAIESFTGIRANVFSDTLNLQAMSMIAGNLRRAYTDGRDIEARKNMLYASCMSGMAFSNTQNALAHALSHVIGGRYHLPHALITAVVCPWVMEFNMHANPLRFGAIARAFGEATNGASELETARMSVKAITSLLNDIGISHSLSSFGIPSGDMQAIAEAAMLQTRLISNNPRRVTQNDVVGLLEAHY